MHIATISDFKAHLSAWLERVKAGDDILVTDRGLPVARVVPVAVPETLDERTAALCRAGLIRTATEPLPTDFWTTPRPEDVQGAALRALLEEREQGR